MESILIHVGPFSCFTGAHFWNSKGRDDEADDTASNNFFLASNTRDVDQAVFLEEGLFHTDRANKRSPRAIYIDLQENIGRTSNSNGLFGDIGDDVSDSAQLLGMTAWNGKLERIETEPVSSNAEIRNIYSTYAEMKRLQELSHNNPAATQSLMDPLMNLKNELLRRRNYKKIMWTDILKHPLQEHSLTPLPYSAQSENFDTYFNGRKATSDSLDLDYLETVLEKIRFYAEGCDRVSSIDIHLDLDGGFGGLGVDLLQQIREDYGNGTNIPVYGFCQKSYAHSISMHDKLSILSLPLVYSDITEYSTSFMPVWTKSISDRYNDVSSVAVRNIDSIYTASSVFALAYDTMKSVSSELSNHSSFAEILSQSKRFPVLSLDLLVPFANGSSAEANIFERIAKNYSSRSEEEVVNPFMKSLSLADAYLYENQKSSEEKSNGSTNGNGFGKSTASGNSRGEELPPRSLKVYSNSMFFSGNCSSTFARQLFQQAEIGFRLDRYLSIPSKRLLPLSFPFEIFVEDAFLSSSGQHNSLSEFDECRQISALASLHADSKMGRHVEDLARVWCQYALRKQDAVRHIYTDDDDDGDNPDVSSMGGNGHGGNSSLQSIQPRPHGARIRAQLEKFDYGTDQCVAVKEALEELSNLYR